MSDINRVNIIGRLTRDAELKYANSGTAILDFSMAYSRRIKKGDQWEDKSCFINGVLFGKRAEGLHQYMIKGQQIAVDAELDFEMWEKDGQKRSKHSLVNVNIQLLGGNKQEYTPSETGVSENGGSFEDNIPF